MSSSAEAEYTEADLAYIEAEYATLEELCVDRAEEPVAVRRLVAGGTLPKPAYTLPDGREMFPHDYFSLVDDAGGVEALPGYFEDRHRATTSALGLVVDPGEDWTRYLSGEFGVSLREVTPEAMVERAALVAEIESLVAIPAVGDDGWRAKLGNAVDDLDEVERPFTDYDRQRWGGTSRDAHITTVRAQYLQGD